MSWPNPYVPFTWPFFLLKGIWEEMTGNTEADKLRRSQERRGVVEKESNFTGRP